MLFIEFKTGQNDYLEKWRHNLCVPVELKVLKAVMPFSVNAATQ
jgi:hypothetical protein